jgi:acyl carrier protein
MDRDEILLKVRGCVAEVLALELDEVRPDSRLMDDLGAESLDLVELMFLLEQAFDIRLSRDDLSLSAQLGLPDEELHRDEVLTERALAALRERFPGSGDFLRPGLTRRHLAQLLTVEELARGVQRKLVAVRGE